MLARGEAYTEHPSKRAKAGSGVCYLNIMPVMPRLDGVLTSKQCGDFTSTDRALSGPVRYRPRPPGIPVAEQSRLLRRYRVEFIRFLILRVLLHPVR